MYHVARGLIAVLTMVTAGAATAAPVRTTLEPDTDLLRVHGNHSLCAGGHRHDWENRRIPCTREDYIFRDGPLPAKRTHRKRRRKTDHHDHKCVRHRT